MENYRMIINDITILEKIFFIYAFKKKNKYFISTFELEEISAGINIDTETFIKNIENIIDSVRTWQITVKNEKSWIIYKLIKHIKYKDKKIEVLFNLNAKKILNDLYKDYNKSIEEYRKNNEAEAVKSF